MSKRVSKRLGFASTGKRRRVTAVAPTTSARVTVRTDVLRGQAAGGRRREFTGHYGSGGDQGQ